MECCSLFLSSASASGIGFSWSRRGSCGEGEKIKAVVVGSGENGRRVVKSLEESEAYKPVAVVGSGNGSMDGVPITPTLALLGV